MVQQSRRMRERMLEVEQRFNRPLERLLPELINQQGLSATADELGLKPATLNYWLLKLGIIVRRIALAPGESIEIKRNQ
jgi:hypothetical protein